MAAPNAQIALRMQSSQTYQHLPANLRPEWVSKVNSFPPAWLEKPVNKEVFESPRQCLERLNAYGFFEGCLFVSGRQRRNGTPSWDYLCKFHGIETANKRRLEDRVTRDLEGEIVTKRQRDTQNKRLGCPVIYCLSFKLVNRATNQRAYVGRWKEDMHQHHELYLNPFSFNKHVQTIPEYQQQVSEALKLRINHQPYSKVVQLLRGDSGGLLIDERAYYNLVRHQKLDKNNQDTVSGLLRALDEQGFRFRLRTEETFDGDRLVNRKLLQIFFYAPAAVQLTQRWAAGHAIAVDATFNTNSLQLPLLVAVGITNENKTFPIAFSYCASESAEAFIFFFESLRTELFNSYVPEPAVILSDLALGIISAFDTHLIMPHSQLQFCTWHVAKAIRERFHRTGRYTYDEITGWRDTDGSHIGLTNLIWAYIQSESEQLLETNRAALLDALQVPEKEYLNNNYVSKERRFVGCYTSKMKNLGQAATQRSESYHRVLKQVTHQTFSLEASAKALCGKLNEIYTLLSTAEDQAAMNRLTALDTHFFRLLTGSVSLFAIKTVQQEWIAMLSAPQRRQELDECSCSILAQYSLPCRHYLRPLYEEGTPIPRSFLHPRWWLRGPTIQQGPWAPFQEQQSVRPPSPRQQDVHSVVHRMLSNRDRLHGDERARYDSQIFSIGRSMDISARDKEAQALIPIRNPDAVQKKAWKKTKPTANARLMTGIEAIENAHKKQLQTTKRSDKSAAILHKRAQQQQQVSATNKDRRELISPIRKETQQWRQRQPQHLLPLLRWPPRRRLYS